jgi:NADP-dependent 3-hydroxy acid dehydrogenase YdfG
LAALEEKLPAERCTAVTYATDLTGSESAVEVVALADEKLTDADALVNNAGIVDYADFFSDVPGRYVYGIYRDQIARLWPR